MRKISTTTLLFLLTAQVFAQMRTISGTLTSNDGIPLPGVNISVKGTTRGTTSDANGQYTISASVGETLVFSFIGMQTREIVVTRDNFPATKSKEGKHKKQKSYDAQPIPKSLFQDTVSESIQGLAILKDNTPSYKNGPIDPSTIRGIKKTPKGVTLRTTRHGPTQRGFMLKLSSSFGFEKVNKLPSLQKEYSQGRPEEGQLKWKGSESNEIFSWGPLIKELEYDGNKYPYDYNGALVLAGTGNGKAANIYDPISFFGTGITSATELTLVMPGPNAGTVFLDAEVRNRTSVIPNSSYRRINLSSSLQKFQITDRLYASASALFNRSHGNLLNRGANYANIVANLYRTPPTFDNANGHEGNKAYEYQNSFLLDDGSVRSHAPAFVDNPNGLVSQLPDHEQFNRVLGSIGLNYDLESDFDINLNANIDSQWNDIIFGIPPGYAPNNDGRLTAKAESNSSFNAILIPTYYLRGLISDLKLSLSYQAQYIKRHMERADGFGFTNLSDPIMKADSTVQLGKTLTRSIHEIFLSTVYNYNDWLHLRFSNRSYFSSTIRNDSYTNFFPAGSISIDLDRLFNSRDIFLLRLHTSYARTIRESPLIYSDWAYGSTSLNVENYNAFYEASELIFDNKLVPETESKFETGVRFEGLVGLHANFSYFENQTFDFIAPIFSDSRYVLQNAADITNHGTSFSIGYSRSIDKFSWDTEFVWSKYSTLVNRISGSHDRIPVSGFASAQTALVAGNSFGAIYGTSYLRNSAGELIIGNDGFPIEGAGLSIIGNNIPDWTLGWSSSISWRHLTLSFLINFKRGGDMWNGTQAALDYLGKSATTGEERNITDYVFNGVDEHGNVNAISVTFADPSTPLAQNRWVRYGFDGVGEEYIEDASWLRLSELSVSYTLKRWFQPSVIKEAKFGVTAFNLLLHSSYSGVDPATNLFGYTTGSGLDLFNAPATRRFSAQITLKI